MHLNLSRQCRNSIFLVVLCISAQAQTCPAQELLPFDSWKSLCLKTPANRVLRGRMPNAQQRPLKDFSIVQSTAVQLLKQFQNSDLAQDANWIGELPEDDKFFAIDRSYFRRPPIPFQPFAQKVKIPSGAEVIFHGDLHGDIRSLITTLDWLNTNDYLDGFKLKKVNTYFVFLGDYVDRGSYGIEVLYTLMRLKLANPNRVLMTRGNHEDFEMTARYGFLREGQLKYGAAFDPLSLWRMYDFLPVVIYLGVGNDYVQCNHGGMEPGYDPKSLLTAEGKTRFQFLGKIQQKTFAEENPDWLQGASQETLAMAKQKLADFTPRSPVSPNPIGFMWNDYFVFKDEPVLGFNQARLAFNHGQASARYLMNKASSETASLRAVFRAHQHSSAPNPMMNRMLVAAGVFRHWQDKDSSDKANLSKSALRSLIERAERRPIPEGSVWTFNVSPDSVYGDGNNYTFDTIGILSTADAFQDWRMRVVNLQVPAR